MATPSNSGSDVFDIRRVRRLVELMQENELTELDIQQGEMRIQLKRNAVVPALVPGVFPAAPVPAATAVAVPTPVVASEPVEDRQVHVIKSPMVGTFYARANPDAPPFVKVGDTLSPDKTVCLIEAMKVFNEIQAECSGKVVAILVKDGEPVEFGKPLFKVSVE